MYTVPALFGLQRGRKINASYRLLIYAIDKQAYIVMKNLGGKFSQVQFLIPLRVAASSSAGLVLCDARMTFTQVIM